MPGNTIDSCQGLLAPQSIIAMFYLISLLIIVLHGFSGILKLCLYLKVDKTFFNALFSVTTR